MSREYEIKYEAKNEDVLNAIEKLSALGDFRMGSFKEDRHIDLYYDTHDLACWKQGLVVRFRKRGNDVYLQFKYVDKKAKSGEHDRYESPEFPVGPEEFAYYRAGGMLPVNAESGEISKEIQPFDDLKDLVVEMEYLGREKREAFVGGSRRTQLLAIQVKRHEYVLKGPEGKEVILALDWVKKVLPDAQETPWFEIELENVNAEKDDVKKLAEDLKRIYGDSIELSDISKFEKALNL